jgi:hypothetical protein
MVDSRDHIRRGIAQQAQVEIIVPELEEMLKSPPAPRYRPWSDIDEGRLERYYGKVPLRNLMKVLGRTRTSVLSKARDMGLEGSCGKDYPR